MQTEQLDKTVNVWYEYFKPFYLVQVNLLVLDDNTRTV